MWYPKNSIYLTSFYWRSQEVWRRGIGGPTYDLMKQNYCNRKKRKEIDLLLVSTTLNCIFSRVSLSEHSSVTEHADQCIHTCGSDLILATTVWCIHTDKWIGRIMREDCWMMVEGRFKNSFVIIDNFLLI